jgi:hypothetical protein
MYSLFIPLRCFINVTDMSTLQIATVAEMLMAGEDLPAVCMNVDQLWVRTIFEYSKSLFEVQVQYVGCLLHPQDFPAGVGSVIQTVQDMIREEKQGP